jgi:hypothetical protein
VRRIRQAIWVPSVLVGVALTTVAACNGKSPTQPTTDAPPDFIIANGMNALTVGGTSSFDVVAYTASNDRNAYLKAIPQFADVSDKVHWSSDNPVAASFRRGGILVGRSVGHVNITASYMGRSHTLPVDVVAPSPIAQQFAGSWSGIAYWRCQDLRGNTRTCEYRTGPFLSLLDVKLSLTAVDGVLQGTIDFGGYGRTHSSGAVVGGITDDGTLAIGGETRLLSEHRLDEQLREWRFRRVGNTLLGSGIVDSAFVNIYSPVWHRMIFVEITLQ